MNRADSTLRWWKCTACGFTMGYHPDDIQPTRESTTYCDKTGQYETIVSAYDVELEAQHA